MKHILVWICVFGTIGIVLYYSGLPNNYEAEIASVDSSVDSQYETAFQLIVNNSRDSAGQTKAGFEKGLRLIEKIHEEGNNTLKVRKLLAESYMVYANKYLEDEPNMQSEYHSKSKKAYEQLIAEYPDDIQMLEDYVTLLNDDKSINDVYRKILEIDPNNIRAHRAIYYQYLNDGDMEKAVKELKIIFTYATDSHDIENFGNSLSAFLERFGQHDEAGRIRAERDRRIKALWEK